MIQILTVKDDFRRRMICKSAGIEYNIDLHIIAVYSEDEVVQGAVFRYNETSGEILWIDLGDDQDLNVGLGKAVLSIMDLRGVKYVSMPMSLEDLALQLKFMKTDNKYNLNLEGYFCCSCQHN